jgi:hypothetical protein
MNLSRAACFAFAVGLLLLPRGAWSQSATTGGIAGVVRDGTGAVLPGVTVEAASPALIEETRIAVTDQQGNEDRFGQFDFRLAKTLRLGRARLQGMFDVYKRFNPSSVLAESFAYGANWLRPSGVLSARLVKFGGQIDF